MGEAARASDLAYLRTPRPTYDCPGRTTAGSELRDLTETARINAAIREVLRQYTGAVADALIDALMWHQSTAGRVSPTSLPARLVAELLGQPL